MVRLPFSAALGSFHMATKKPARVSKKKIVPAKKSRLSAKKAKPAAPKKSVKAKKPEVDEYSARGGFPLIGTFPAVDRSTSRRSTLELSWREFDTHVHTLARQAHNSFGATAVVGLAHGGVFVGGALASAMRVEFFPVRLTRRSRDLRNVRVTNEMPTELKGRRVLLVDDVAGSGDSLEMAARLAKLAGATHVATATLVARPDEFTPDFAALHSEVFYVFPWDYQEVVEDARFDPDMTGG